MAFDERGSETWTIFRCDGDRRLFFELLGKAIVWYDRVLHACCLMNNHVLPATAHGKLVLLQHPCVEMPQAQGDSIAGDLEMMRRSRSERTMSRRPYHGL